MAVVCRSRRDLGNRLAAAPPVDGRTIRLTLGGLGLLLLGGIAYQLTRRRRKLAAPA